MNQRYAGFGVRLVATLIDSILLGLVQWVIGVLLKIPLGENGINFASVIAFLISIGYYVVYQQKQGQTIGKKVMKIKVITLDGNTPTMFTFFLREVIGKLISAIILLIGYLMVLWDGKKQALHDKIASTYVVYVEPAATVQQMDPVHQQQPTVATQQPISQQSTVLPTQQIPAEPRQELEVTTQPQTPGEPQQPV